MRNSTGNVSRDILAVLALVALLAGCSAAPGGDSQGGENSTSSDAADSGDSGESGDSGSSVVDACTLIPDADLETALGGPLAPEREEYPQSGSQLCRISSAADPPALLSLEIAVTGRDGFERSRDNKDDIPDLYQPLTGIGDDAFAFGHEVTMLKGNYVVVVFLEGLPFDGVADADRLNLAMNLATAAAAQLD
jgi:hypothetical protein